MKLWVDAFRMIALNLGMLIFSWVYWVFFAMRLNILFPKFARLLGVPYEIFRAHSENGEVNLSKHCYDANSKAGAAILDLMYLPYNLYRDGTDTMGESEFDRESLKLWFTVGWVAPILLLILFVVL